jgi:hypothetical protein
MDKAHYNITFLKTSNFLLLLEEKKEKFAHLDKEFILILQFLSPGTEPNVTTSVSSGRRNTGVREGSGIQLWVRKNILSIITKHRNRLNLEPALILALAKIRPRTEVLACQTQAQSSP